MIRKRSLEKEKEALLTHQHGGGEDAIESEWVYFARNNEGSPSPSGRCHSPGPGPGHGMYGSTGSAHKEEAGAAAGVPPSVSLRVDRAVMEQRELQGRFSYHGTAHASTKCSEKEEAAGCWSRCTACCLQLPRPRPAPGCCSARTAASAVRSLFPIVDWLGRYKVKEDLMGDLVSGFTVAVMHIPQGLAYALLGNVPPVVGIYMAFFPVLVYCLFGTSRHVSMGTFAVICLMTGRVVTAHSAPHVPDGLSAGNGTDSLIGTLPSPVEVASAVACVVGAAQLAMWALRLGVLSALLSDALVSGFTTAAAIHVLTSQIKDLLGLTLPSAPKGAFKVVTQWVSICVNIGSANVAAVVVSLLTMLLLTANNEAVKPWLSRRCPLPLPVELVVVIAGTLLSMGPDSPLAPYSLTPLGHIPTGFPAPTLPSADLLWSVALESLPIAVVAYTIAMSLALIFATKNGYEVRPNQELLAQGAANVVGSLFSCMPVTASLSRSAVQEAAGCRTQLTSLVSCGLLTLVLLWAGPFFEPLPRCVLAAIIVVALRSMIMQVRDAPRFVRNSRWDGAVWVVTFLAVVLVDIDLGLGVGAALSLLALVCQGVRPVCHTLAPLPGTDLYVDPELYGAALRVPGVAIVRFAGIVNFATRSAFRDSVYKLVGLDPEKELARQKQVQQGHLGPAGSTDNFVEEMKRQEPAELHAVVLDLSGVLRVDAEGVRAVLRVADQYAAVRVTLFLAAPSDVVLGVLVKCGAARVRTYPSVHDAVTAASAHVPDYINVRV